MNFNQQMTIIRESMRAKRISRDGKVRFISPSKWRSIMCKCLTKFKTKNIFDDNLVEDLITIIDKIPEEKFVEATLNLEPFRPSFKIKPRKDDKNEKALSSRVNTVMDSPKMKYKQTITRFKHSVHEKLIESDLEAKSQSYKKSVLEEMISLVTEETTLTKEFESKHHPYRKIIEQFLFLLENKYKMVIDAQETVDIEKTQEKLVTDLSLLQEFIVKSSEPYLNIFKSENQEEKETFQIKLTSFIRQYVQKNERINVSIRKIMRAACKKSTLIRQLTEKLPDFAQVEDFQIPQEFRIDGCYANSMSTLIQFAETTTSLSSLQKLREFRNCLGKDLEEHYKGQLPEKLQLTADTQLQIMKFVVVKVKTFICEIYAQLKYLEVVCGEEDMSYRYDDSSYMYAQLSVVYEALEMDYCQGLSS